MPPRGKQRHEFRPEYGAIGEHHQKVGPQGGDRFPFGRSEPNGCEHGDAKSGGRVGHRRVRDAQAPARSRGRIGQDADQFTAGGDSL